MPLSKLTDAIDFVRKHPEMFFSGGVPSPLACAQHLVAEALVLGGVEVNVVVERRGDWWIVSSNFDWFLGDQSEDEQVQRLVPLPEVGPNASRVEIVLMAFADAVATRRGNTPWRGLAGSGLPADAERGELLKEPARAVAFRFVG